MEIRMEISELIAIFNLLFSAASIGSFTILFFLQHD